MNRGLAPVPFEKTAGNTGGRPLPIEFFGGCQDPGRIIPRLEELARSILELEA